MSWFGSNKEEVNEVLGKIEHIVTEKTQRLSFIEESLQGLVEQLAQSSCAVELAKLQEQFDKVEEKSITLQEENLNLQKQIRELRLTGKTPASTSPASAGDSPALRTQLEQAQQELETRNSEFSSLKEEMERQAQDNDIYIENLNAQLTALRQQLEEVQGDDSRAQEHTAQLTQAQQLADSLSLQVDELQQQLATAQADNEVYVGQVAQLTEAQQTVDQLNAQVGELQQQLATVQADNEVYVGQVAQLVTQLEQKTADVETARKQTETLQEQEKQLSEQLRNSVLALDTKSAEAAELSAKLSSAENATATLRGEKTALSEQLSAGEREIKAFLRMQDRFFPKCLLIPDIEPSIAEWKTQLTASEPDYRVLSMLSYLFSWVNILENLRKNPENLNSNVEKEAISAIVYFSRYFLEVLYARGFSTDEVQNISIELIERFNSELSAAGIKHQLVVPFLGESYDSQSMMLDSSRGNTYGEVVAVLSWGVRNSGATMFLSKPQVQLG